MTSLTIELPDALAARARQAGLLEPEKLIRLISRQLEQATPEAPAATAAAEEVFQPFRGGQHPVTNEQINRLREMEGI
ncbi:MAG: hypothetical protein QM740_06590 [Acidovorax sp.]